MELFLKNTVVTQIVLACFIPKDAKGGAIHNNRPSHGFALNLDGDKTYAFNDGKKITVNKNDLIYLPKGSCYTVSSLIRGDMYCINFQTAEDGAYPPFALRVKNIDNMLAAYREAEKAWRKKNAGYDYKCKAELYKVIYETYKESALPYSDNKKMEMIRPALEYIHKHYADEQISMQKLCKSCSISYEYLRKLFHNFYACSPTEYVNNLRIERAKNLLASGYYSVSEAAEKSGFFDVAYFSRFFKKTVGVTPAKFNRV